MLEQIYFPWTWKSENITSISPSKALCDVAYSSLCFYIYCCFAFDRVSFFPWFCHFFFRLFEVWMSRPFGIFVSLFPKFAKRLSDGNLFSFIYLILSCIFASDFKTSYVKENCNIRFFKDLFAKIYTYEQNAYSNDTYTRGWSHTKMKMFIKWIFC